MVQSGVIATIQQNDINKLNWITTLEAKFPITSLSILDETTWINMTLQSNNK
jgi:hypothetical protein